MKKIFFLILALFLFARPAGAVYFQHADNLTLPQNQKINDSVFVSGNNLNLNSDINGDLFCIGQDITLTGHITGDVYCAGRNIKIDGPVDGSVILGGENIDLNSAVSRNVIAAGGHLNLNSPGKSGLDFIAAGNSVTLNSLVGRDALVAGNSVTLNSLVGRSVTAAAANLLVSSSAKIKGNLYTYINDQSVTAVSPGTVLGRTVHYQLPRSASAPSPAAAAQATGYFELYTVLSLLLLGVCFLYFAPGITHAAVGRIASNPFGTFFAGLGFLFITPLLFILLLVTVIGIPLAFVLLLLYIIALISAVIYTATAFGDYLLRITHARSSYYFGLILGLILFRLLILIPLLGGLLSFIFFCLGLGGYYYSLFAKKPVTV